MDLNGDAANPEEVGQQPGTSNYIVSVSQSKRYLFAYQLVMQEMADETITESSEPGKMTTSLINVIDIQNEQIIAKIKTHTQYPGMPLPNIALGCPN